MRVMRPGFSALGAGGQAPDGGGGRVGVVVVATRVGNALRDDRIAAQQDQPGGGEPVAGQPWPGSALRSWSRWRRGRGRAAAAGSSSAGAGPARPGNDHLGDRLAAVYRIEQRIEAGIGVDRQLSAVQPAGERPGKMTKH